MSDQEQQRAPQPKDHVAKDHVAKDHVAKDHVAETSAPAKTDTSLADGLDDLLDEIDEVLETNAEEFVKSYVQKGGQ